MSETPPYRPDPLADDFRPMLPEPGESRDSTHDLRTSMFGDPFGAITVPGGTPGASGVMDSPAAEPDARADRPRPRPRPRPDEGANEPHAGMRSEAAPAPPQAPRAASAAQVAAASPRAGVAPRPPTGVAPASRATPWQQATGAGGTWSPQAVQSPAGCRKAGIIIGLFVIVPVLIALVSAVVGLLSRDDDDDGSSRERSDPTATAELTVTPVRPGKHPAPALPTGATKVRFEFVGLGRTADIIVHRDGRMTSLDATDLPFAVEVPIDSATRYLTARVNDDTFDEASGGSPLECRAYLGKVLVALNVGTDRVECTLTDASFPRK